MFVWTLAAVTNVGDHIGFEMSILFMCFFQTLANNEIDIPLILVKMHKYLEIGLEKIL